MQDRPCSPASISQTVLLPILGLKCFKHAFLMFSMVSFSSHSSNWTNSLDPMHNKFITCYHTVLCTVISSFTPLLSLPFPDFLPVRFSFIEALNALHSRPLRHLWKQLYTDACWYTKPSRKAWRCTMIAVRPCRFSFCFELILSK
jgi:hypothetical protein